MSTVLNEADALYYGGEVVDRVYLGADKVWPPPVVFDPSSLAGLTIWLDASQLGLADGVAVSPWPNLGSGADASMVGTPAPAVKTGSSVSGLPVVRFKINEGRVRMTGTGIDLDYTLVYIARMVPGGYTSGRIVNGIYTPANILWGFWNGYQDVAYAEGFLTPDMKVSVTTAWKLYSADAAGVSPDYKPRFFSDGVFLSGDHSSAGGWKGTFAISGYDPSGAAETCDCEVAEVLLYNRKLSDTDRQAVEGYLRGKWGL